MTDDIGTKFVIGGDPLIEDPERRRELYARVFGSVDGRIVLADILQTGGCGIADWDPGMSAEAGFYRFGWRGLSLDIAYTAGLDKGRIGLALVEGKLESMKEPHDEDET